MGPITPVILAGGTGKRLWPLSRQSYPKQFSNLLNEQSLFQLAIRRLESSPIIDFTPPIVVTNVDYRFLVLDQMGQIRSSDSKIVVEPFSRNTAGAILAASLIAVEADPDSILLSAPADHVIPDNDAFHGALVVGLRHASMGKMVAFGIEPTHPASSYGYLKLSESKFDDLGTAEVVQFVEKPSEVLAREMLATGNYLWNSGINIFKACDMINAFARLHPELLKLTREAVETAEDDLAFIRLQEKPWAQITDISVDYAILEKVQNLVAIPYRSKWSDLGSWDAVWAISEKDKFGLVSAKNTHAIDCSNTLLRSESDGQQVFGIGLDNIVVIAMPDAVLVANKDRAQDVKFVVDALKEKKIRQADDFPKEHRPWGWFETISLEGRYRVKKIYVSVGQALSLQSHHHRSEHWVVVQGTAEVTINDNVQVITEGMSVYVPIGSTHRLKNPGKISLILIEVQTGSYLEEDDIVRYEDKYSRK